MTSRTPVNGVGYDKSLLADAPEITKADKQEGYNPDLLEQGKTSGRPSPRPGTVPPAGALPPGAKYGGSDSSHGRAGGGKHIATAATAPPTKKQRSNKLWWIVAGIVFLLVVAIAVGVGVGVGTKKKSTSNAAFPPPNANSTDNGGKTDSSADTGGGKTSSSTDSGGADLVPAQTAVPSDNNAGGGVGGDGTSTATTKS